jgi:23S rRNA G2445 N2-methylase RlmL
MAKQRTAPDPQPALYAVVHPGLETVAADEISRDFNGEVKRTAPGLVVFRVSSIDADILKLRTTEDVFLLAWGTDQLTYRAEDLERIERWTARDVNWDALLRIHHRIRAKPKGKPTYRLVAQMNGTHGYRRVDARDAMARGLGGKLPASWRHAEENAAVEIWLTIDGARAYCGMRLSDRTMRHRTYKEEHVAASLRPTIAAAMIRLAEIGSRQIVVDPMCGAGTIVGECLAFVGVHGGNTKAVGGDSDVTALRAAAINLRRFGDPLLIRWDATRLPLADQSIDAIVSNPPFGKQLGRADDIPSLYRKMVREYDRVLRPKGRVVLLVSEYGALRSAAQKVNWHAENQLRVRVLGQNAVLSGWRKTAGA